MLERILRAYAILLCGSMIDRGICPIGSVKQRTARRRQVTYGEFVASDGTSSPLEEIFMMFLVSILMQGVSDLKEASRYPYYNPMRLYTPPYDLSIVVHISHQTKRFMPSTPALGMM